MKKLTNYLYILIILLLIIFGIWNRFIRIRLPKEIPFNLSLFNFFILLIGCILLLTNIIYLFRPKEIKITTLIENSIKDFIKIFMESLMNIKFFANNYSLIIIKTTGFILRHYYILHYLNLIPRLILACAFTIDIYNDQLFWSYKAIFIYLLIYVKMLIINHLKIIKIDRSYQIQENWEIRINQLTKIISIEELINFQTAYIDLHQTLFHYSLIIKDKFSKYLTITYGSRKEGRRPSIRELDRNARKVIQLIIDVHIILYLYDMLEKKDKAILIAIKVLYIIGWIYIIIISLPILTISMNEWIFLKTFQEMFEPFSQLKL